MLQGKNMSSTETKRLSHDIESNRKLFYRYYHAYSRAYHDIQWELEEIRLLLLNHEHSDPNTWKLNESLYRYAESSINTLWWFNKKLKKRIEFPFVHKFLREWRNENHHAKKTDFKLSDLSTALNGDRVPRRANYYVINVFSCDKLKAVLKEHFGGDVPVTDATVAGLVKNHHDFMVEEFTKFQTDMERDMPENYMIGSNVINMVQLHLGNFDQLISEEDFWGSKN
jgi:hypothetical protein